MLRRLVKEATGGFSSSSDRPTTRKREKNSETRSRARRRADDDVASSEEEAKRQETTTTTDQEEQRRQRRAAKMRDEKRRERAGRIKREPLLELHVIEAVHGAMHDAKTKKKHKAARHELRRRFKQRDPDDTGLVDDATFMTCITKAGIKLKKSSDVEALATCFRRVLSDSDAEDSESSTDGKHRRKKKTTSTRRGIDYVAFLDFASNVRDSEKLSAIADKLRAAINKYDDKHNRTTTTPFNIFEELRQRDKRKRGWIPSDKFATFLDEHEQPVLRLSSQEIAALVERFEYEFEKGELGVDYKEFAQWLQPMLHLNIKELHKRVKELVAAAQQRGGWQLDEIFETMDEDRDGHVSGEELKDTLFDMGLPLTDAQIRCLVDEYDTNGDGKIQYEEFLTLFPPAPAKRQDQKKRQYDSESSGTEREKDRKERTKRTVRNTFSWGIAKAFARKHAQQKSKKREKEKRHESDTSSSEAKGKTIRRRNKTRGEKNSSDDELSESTQSERDDNRSSRSKNRRAKESERDKRKRNGSRTAISSADDSSDQESLERKKHHRSKNNRMERAKDDHTSSDSDERHKKKKKKDEHLKRSRRDKKTADTTDNSELTEAHSAVSPGTDENGKHRTRGRSKTRSRESHRHRSQSAVSRQSSRARSKVRKSTRSERHVSASRKQSVERERSSSQRRSKRHTSSIDDRQRRRASARRHSMSTVGSDGESTKKKAQNQGLDIDEVRKLQQRPKSRPRRDRQLPKGTDTASEGESTESMGETSADESTPTSRSDAEYERELKKALRRAFDFFDLDHSEAIDKKELSHVLRALGHEFTSDELNRAMEKADLDKNGELDFHEFFRFVKKQLSNKAFLLSKQREMTMRQAFQSLDTDKNGYVDEKEFEYLIYKVLQVELSVEEQDALLDFVDTNGDGNINEDEFIAFMKAMDEFHEQGVMSKVKQQEMLDNLDTASRLACSALKKLVRGAPVDLNSNLLMFFGIPSNFRPAITSSSTCRGLQENSIEHALSYPCPETIVGLAQDKVSSDASNVLKVRKDDDSEEAILIRQAENWEAHAIVSLKRATGVPKPFDDRESDVIKRCVHVCLFQEEEQIAARKKIRNTRKHSKPHNLGVVVGNVHEIPVYWRPEEEDVWEFSKSATKEDKYKFLVRTNNVNDQLYLLIEFIVHIRMANEGPARKKRKPQRHRNDEEVQDIPSTSKNESGSREMVACWCKVPIRVLLARRTEVWRSRERLWGGTAHAPIDIEQDEILRRRTGWRAISNAFRKPSPPEVGVKSAPVESYPEDVQGFVRKMPPTIIAPFVALPVLTEYMLLMQDWLASKATVASRMSCLGDDGNGFLTISCVEQRRCAIRCSSYCHA
ncbi:hypothetical protein PINS_up001288 [Pythium insidiosum]|nr:hypothetical protein PINS_up001288 [Pythium insidiosum]